MTPAGIIDIAALVLLAGFTFYGAWRGLVKTVAGLILTIATIVGAMLIASILSGPLSEWIAPKVENWVAEQVKEAVESQDIPTLAADAAGLDGVDVDFSAVDFSSIPLDSLSSLLKTLGMDGELPQSMTDRLSNGLEDLRGAFSGTLSEAISKVLAGILRPACYGILYILSYFLLSILGGIIMKVLDPILKLPFLHTVDSVGGGALGLAEGCLIVWIALWVLSRFELEALSGSFMIREVIPRTSQLLSKLPFLH